MRVSIVIISDNQKVCIDVSNKKSGIIPESTRKLTLPSQKRADFVVSSFNAAGRNLPADLDSYVESIAASSDYVLLIIQDNLTSIGSRYDNIFFISKFALTAGQINTQNLLGSVVSKSIKELIVFCQRFEDHKYQKILLLPFNNFNAQDFRILCALFSFNGQRVVFGSQLDDALGKLRKRQTPKRPKTHNAEYLKDDSKNFYSYGHERHAQPDSIIPPHNLLCSLAHKFRFGHSYDGRRHFNVTKEGEGSTIGGNFIGCHFEVVNIVECSHINMFPNNFAC